LTEIEAQVKELQASRTALKETKENETERIGLGSEGHFDTDIYTSSKLSGLSSQYVDSIGMDDDQEVCPC